MLIGMLLAVVIVGLLVTGAGPDDVLVAIALYGGLIVAMILAFIYSERLSLGIAGFFLGGSAGGRVQETYSLAERYEVEHKFEDAIRTYLEALERDRRNPTPRLRLADLYYRLGDYDNCVKYMHEALSVTPKMSQSERCAVMNRIADVYLQHKRDPASAVAILKQLIREFPKSKSALYARDRIARIRKDF